MKASLALIGVLIPVAAVAAGRDVAIIIDTSGSMDQSDRPRFTAQLAKIISDLLEPEDNLTVIRMPGSESCSSGPDPSLAARFNASNRAGFKQAVDALASYSGGTYFASPVRTAIRALTLDASKSRLLLMLADSGGLSPCDVPLTEELKGLRNSGAAVAAINLGPSGGAFDGNPAFTFTTGAPDVENMAKAVAQVYQRFLGAKRVQTGSVSSSIAIQVPAHVRSAFFVVASDGPIAAVDAAAGNPGADAIDANYRGGGETRGLDGRLRGYRIVHMRRPKQGNWTFVPRGTSAGGGWMLVLDYAVGVRLRSSSEFIAGAPGAVELEVYDEDTSVRLDPASLPGLEITLDSDGRTERLTDDGKAGDRTPGDGVYSASVTFSSTGAHTIRAMVRTGDIERSVSLETKVLDVDWVIRSMTPARVEAGTPVTVSARLQPSRPAMRAGAVRPAAIDASLESGEQLLLHDDGMRGDVTSGDGVYSGTWQPKDVGRRSVEYRATGGSPAGLAKADVDVLGRVEFGPAIPITLGTLRGGSTAQGEIDLSHATVFGSFDIRANTSLSRSGVALEVDLGLGWQRLDSRSLPVTLDEHGRRRWPVRIRVGDCPGGITESEHPAITFEAATASGQPVRLAIPLAVVVMTDSWLHCWWPVLAALATTVIVSFVAYGYWSPWRFPPSAAVLISDVEDLNEGFLHPIGAQRGTGVGFYSDAAVFICSDYRLRATPNNAVARLRAGPRALRIKPLSGSLLVRNAVDDEWKDVPQEESSVRNGVSYRDAAGTVFFEMRSG